MSILNTDASLSPSSVYNYSFKVNPITGARKDKKILNSAFHLNVLRAQGLKKRLKTTQRSSSVEHAHSEQRKLMMTASSSFIKKKLMEKTEIRKGLKLFNKDYWKKRFSPNKESSYMASFKPPTKNDESNKCMN
ncbi:unnamed protein product [Moneuplotes crassus]|uniref:Uncharacterized protein n=1 Tax=Euplotes crassus TaxID=5936 RepID=A0AAD1XHF5_EUPCR|nr:unnamed protein product [Moneuplotes crassus]